MDCEIGAAEILAGQDPSAMQTGADARRMLGWGSLFLQHLDPCLRIGVPGRPPVSVRSLGC